MNKYILFGDDGKNVIVEKLSGVAEFFGMPTGGKLNTVSGYVARGAQVPKGGVSYTVDILVEKEDE